MYAVSTHGAKAPSYRERIHRWLEITGTAASTLTYGDIPRLRARHVAQRPLAIGAHEWNVRTLSRRGAERILLHREASPFSRGELERSLLMRSDHGILDFDDALYAHWGDVGWSRSILARNEKLGRYVSAADVVIAGCPTLASWAAEHSSRVVVVPTCVDLSDYDAKDSYELPSLPLIGWIGSATTEQYVVDILPALDELYRRKPFVFEVISTPHRSRVLDGRPYVRRVPWTPSVLGRLSRWDVGIMPLRDSEFERGKCGYKLLQYGASGLPAVASPVGVNRDIIKGGSLSAAVSTSDWMEAILSTLEAPAAVRKAMGDAALRNVRLRYTFDVWRERWERAIGSRLD